MKSEYQPRRQRAQSPEMEMDSIFNVLNVLECDAFVDEDNAIDLRAKERVHSDGTSPINYDEPKALDDTENAIYRRCPIDITSNDMNHFTITPETMTDNIASFGISISVIVHTL